ncbi:MAG TPA: hypothetical protein VF113_03495 [Stellaceae bacterium]
MNFLLGKHGVENGVPFGAASLMHRALYRCRLREIVYNLTRAGDSIGRRAQAVCSLAGRVPRT